MTICKSSRTVAAALMLSLGVAAFADVSGGYMSSQSESLSYLSLTQTKDKLEGTWQYVAEDRKEPSWYKASSTQVTGTIVGKKFTLKTAAGVLLQGRVLSKGIQIRIATIGAEAITLEYQSSTDKAWNAAVEKFKKEKSNSALACRFGLAIQNRIERLGRERTGARNVITLSGDYLSDLEIDLREKWSERNDTETQIAVIKLDLEEARTNLADAEKEEERANAEEVRNNTPENREAAREARRKASEARQIHYTANSQFENMAVELELIYSDLESLNRRKGELQLEIKDALVKLEASETELRALGTAETMKNVQSLLVGAFSACKITTASVIYRLPDDQPSEIIYSGKKAPCLTIQTGLTWSPVLLSSGGIGWIKA